MPARRYGTDMAEIGEPATEKLLVRVQNTTKHQLAAGVDELDVHCESDEFEAG